MMWRTVVLSALTVAIAAGPKSNAGAAEAPTKASFLGFHFIANAEPMSNEEGARLGQIENTFISKLEAARLYKFSIVPDEMRGRITKGQPPGECSGCEIDYGEELGVPIIMWGTVQKVSNLILNLNIYMADVNGRKMTFVKSVDMRGNTDETWQQAVNYMIKRYIIKKPASQSDE
jgi:hypothetical protein